MRENLVSSHTERVHSLKVCVHFVALGAVGLIDSSLALILEVDLAAYTRERCELSKNCGRKQVGICGGSVLEN